MMLKKEVLNISIIYKRLLNRYVHKLVVEQISYDTYHRAYEETKFKYMYIFFIYIFFFILKGWGHFSIQQQLLD